MSSALSERVVCDRCGATCEVMMVPRLRHDRRYFAEWHGGSAPCSESYHDNLEDLAIEILINRFLFDAESSEA